MKILDELRVKEWIHVVGLPLIGYIFATREFMPFQISLLIVISACSLMFAYILDNSSGRSALLVSLAALSLVLSCLISVQALLIAFAGYLLVAAYSLPPLRLKGVPMLGTALNGIGFGLMVLLGSAAGGRLDIPSAMFSAFCGLVVLPLQLIHEIDHMGEDRKAGHRTTAAAFGAGAARKSAYALLAAMTAFSYLAMGVWLLLPSAAFSIAVAASLKWSRRPRMMSRLASIIFGLAILAIMML